MTDSKSTWHQNNARNLSFGDNGGFRCYACRRDFEDALDECEDCEETFCDDCLTDCVCHECRAERGE